MLTAMRKSASGFVAKIIILLLIASFAVWGIGDMVRGGGTNVIAKVDREEIFVDDFYRSMQLMQQNLGEQFNMEMMRMSQFPQLVLNELIDRKVLEITAREMGLRLDDETLLQFIVESPIFANEEGTFDKNRFMMVLRNTGLSESDYLNQTREGLIVNLLQDTALLHNTAPNALAEALYLAAFEKRSADLLLIDPLAVKLDAEPEQADLQTIYDEIAPQYATPEHKKFDLLSFSADAMRNALNSSIDEDTLRAYYDQHIESYTTPESRKVQQVTFDTKEEADAFYLKISESADIETLMSDQGAKEVTYTNQTGLEDPITDAVFSLPNKRFSTPMESDFGWQIIYLTSIQDAIEKPFDNEKKTIRNALIAEQLDDYVYEQSNGIEDSLAAGKTLEEVKADLPFNASIKTVDTAKDEKAAGSVMESVATLQSGETTGLQLNDGKEYYIAKVTEVTPSVLPELSAIEDKVRAVWETRQRSVKAREVANQVADALANGADVDEAIEGLQVTRTFSGLLTRNENTISNNSLLKNKILTNAFLQDLFRIKDGEATEAYSLASGEYVIGLLKNKIPAPSTDTEEAKEKMIAIQKELAEFTPQEIYGLWMEDLRNRHTTEINYNVLEAVLRQQ